MYDVLFLNFGTFCVYECVWGLEVGGGGNSFRLQLAFSVNHVYHL